TFKLLFAASLGFSLLGVGTILLFSGTFAAIFTNDPQVIALAEWAIRVFMIGSLVFGAQIACQQSFLSLGQASRSLMMALFRKVVLLIPMIFLLPALIGHTNFAAAIAAPIMAMTKDGGSVFAVLAAESVSDFLAACATVTLFYSFYRKHLKNQLSERKTST
ncbi:MAG: MATE family efflux transporter, partial [Oscillospiraceae bacterium]